MTPLNNQELRKKIEEMVSRWFGEPVIAVEDELAEFFESELLNREREAYKKGFIKGGIDEIIRNDKAIKEISEYKKLNSNLRGNRHV